MEPRQKINVTVSQQGYFGFTLGIFWFAWAKVGFWWAIVYSVFWPIWLGFCVAENLKLGQ